MGRIGTFLGAWRHQETHDLTHTATFQTVSLDGVPRSRKIKALLRRADGRFPRPSHLRLDAGYRGEDKVSHWFENLTQKATNPRHRGNDAGRDLRAECGGPRNLRCSTTIQAKMALWAATLGIVLECILLGATRAEACKSIPSKTPMGQGTLRDRQAKDTG